MDPMIDGGGGGKRNGSQKSKENNSDSFRNKKTSAFIFTAGPLANRVNNNSISKAKVRKSKSDHGGTNVGIESSTLFQIDEGNKRTSAASDGSKVVRTTNIGQSHSFNYHHNRQSKKSAVGMGLANMNQQLLSATMFGVVPGGDSKASQQVAQNLTFM